MKPINIPYRKNRVLHAVREWVAAWPEPEFTIGQIRTAVEDEFVRSNFTRYASMRERLGAKISDAVCTLVEEGKIKRRQPGVFQIINKAL